MVLCRKMIESIPRGMATVITKGGEQVYKEYYQNKFDFDETWTKVLHLYITVYKQTVMSAFIRIYSKVLKNFYGKIFLFVWRIKLKKYKN